MKKFFSLLAVLALVCMASSVWADIQGEAKEAYATFDDAAISISVELCQMPETYTDGSKYYETGTPTIVSKIGFYTKCLIMR